MMQALRVVFGASLVGLVACGGGDGEGEPVEQPDVTIRGGLDRATFAYECVGPSDAQCNVDADLAPIRAESGPFPQIALGSLFKMNVSASDYTGITVAPVSADFLQPEGERTYLAKRVGVAAVVAEQGNGTPIDFANIDVVAPRKFKILQATPQGDFRGVNADLGGGSVNAGVDVKFTFKFRAVALAEDDSILAGALPCTWTSSREDVAKIVGDANSNVVTLESGAAGTSEVIVELGDFTGTVRVEVR